MVVSTSRAGLVSEERMGRRKVVHAHLEGLNLARRLLDRYEEHWQGRIDRTTELVNDTKEDL
jgi:hypothetical protein